MGQYILGVDLGTSSMKCACYDEQMQLAAITRAHYCSSGQSPAAEDWWTALLQCLKGLGETLPLRDICCVSFSGYNALVGVDRTLAPVSPGLYSIGSSGPGPGILRRSFVKPAIDCWQTAPWQIV